MRLPRCARNDRKGKVLTMTKEGGLRGGTRPLPICGSLQGTPLRKFSACEPVVNQCPSGIPSYRLAKGDIENHHYHKTYYGAHGG